MDPDEYVIAWDGAEKTIHAVPRTTTTLQSSRFKFSFYMFVSQYSTKTKSHPVKPRKLKALTQQRTTEDAVKAASLMTDDLTFCPAVKVFSPSTGKVLVGQTPAETLFGPLATPGRFWVFFCSLCTRVQTLKKKHRSLACIRALLDMVKPTIHDDPVTGRLPPVFADEAMLSSLTPLPPK